MTLPQIIALLIAIESGGDPAAIGKNGEVGILQIKTVAVDRFNQIAGYRKFTYDDRLDPRKSVEMASLFLSHEIARYRKRVGKHPSPDRIMNSWQTTSIFRQSSSAYQSKVRHRLNLHTIQTLKPQHLE